MIALAPPKFTRPWTMKDGALTPEIQQYLANQYAFITRVIDFETITADAELTIPERLTLANATLGNIIVTLPAVDLMQGIVFTGVKKTDVTANTVTITPSGGALIDGAANFPLIAQYESLTFTSDGTAWWVI